jgi:hypothetical protein
MMEGFGGIVQSEDHLEFMFATACIYGEDWEGGVKRFSALINKEPAIEKDLLQASLQGRAACYEALSEIDSSAADSMDEKAEKGI